MKHQDAPIPGQPAAIVVRGRSYLARFPYAAAPGREAAHAAAVAWRDENDVGAKVKGFTGRIHYVWERSS